MAKRLALGVLIVSASFGAAVAGSAGFEWWQDRGGARQVEVASTEADAQRGEPRDESKRSDERPAEMQAAEAEAAAIEIEAARAAEAQAAMAEAQGAVDATVVAELEAELAAAARAAEAQAALAAELSKAEADATVVAELEAALAAAEAQAAAMDAALALATTSTTVHPQVQAQGMERVLAIVEARSDAWPWVVQALDVARFSFFEEMPSECESAIGCYNHATGDIWLTLDALREPDPLSISSLMGGGHDPGHVVLHELAHAYTRSFPPTELFDLYGRHYAGCHGHNLDTDQFGAELLADTMAMSAMSDGDDLPRDYGYFRSGGFAGCLVESSRPDTALVQAVYAALFNCGSDHALDIFADHRDPWRGSFIRRDFGNYVSGADAVLLTCYGIDCITPDRGCENVTETDERRDTASERLHVRRCADGVVVRGLIQFGARTEPGWEHGCEAHIPDDVECLVDEHGDKPEPYGGLLYAGDVFPGLIDTSGECIKPVCTVKGPQGEPQPGHKGNWGVGECVPIDRGEAQGVEIEAERRAAETEAAQQAAALAAETEAARQAAALAAECADDLNIYGGPGWEQGCKDAGHIPDEVPCVVAASVWGSRGWLPGYIDDRNDRLPDYFNGDGECRPNVALTSAPRAWHDCLPDDGGRWTGDWTATPYNSRYPCQRTLVEECANDVNRSPRLPEMYWGDIGGNRWPPGWEEGCKEAGLIPDEVPCVVSAAAALDVVARHGWRGLSGWLPGQPDGSGGCAANTALLRAVHPEIGLREWLACLPTNGGRWTGDWTANPDNGRDACPSGLTPE